MKGKGLLLAATAGAALCIVVASPAEAQSDAASPPAAVPSADAATTQDIVVTGMRSSLTNAANIKKGSDQVQDSIVAEDIGKFPDTSVAETLQRIPGVQMSRNTRGEGNTYVVRGLKQVMTTVDGRSLFGTTNRTANLLDFSTDILAGLDVYKTATADQIEGGLGGLINIRTARPFDFNGFHLSMSGSGVYSQFQKRVGPRVSGVLSDRWDTSIGEIGVLVGGQFEKYYSAGYQVATNNYSDNTSLFDVNGDGAKGTPADTVTIPGQVRPEYETGNRLRESAYGSVQWRPSSDFELHLDTIYTKSNGAAIMKQLAVKPDSASTGTSVTLKDGSTVPSAYTISNAAVKSTSNYYDDPYFTTNIALGGKYTSGKLTASFEGSYVRSHGPFYARAGTIQGRAGTATFDLSGATPDVSVTGFDPTDPASYPQVSYFEYGVYADGREPSFRGDLSYDVDLGPLKTLMGGFRWSHHRAIYDFFTASSSSSILSTADLTSATPDDLFTNRNTSIEQWLTVSNSVLSNERRTHTVFGLSPSDPTPDPSTHYDYRETTFAGYAEGKFGFNLGPVPVDGNLGLRFVRTVPRQTVLVKDDSGNYTPLTGGTPYNDWLPSANVRFLFTPNLFLRLAFSKAITRPDFGNLSPAILANPSTLSATGGNPSLKPTQADQYDASLEYYFGRSNYASVALFQRDVTGFIETFYGPETVNGETYQVSRPRNSSGGTIKGFEVTYQQFFDFLPGLLSGLGFQGNYTYVDSALSVHGLDYKIPADQLSKNSFNLTGIYEKGPVSLHVSYNWRSKSLVSSSSTKKQMLWMAPQKSLDLSLSYSITKHFQIKADVVNATLAYENEYYGTPLRPALSSELDRSYELGFHFDF
jgi:TonB-dependent receptor